MMLNIRPVAKLSVVICAAIFFSHVVACRSGDKKHEQFDQLFAEINKDTLHFSALAKYANGHKIDSTYSQYFRTPNEWVKQNSAITAIGKLRISKDFLIYIIGFEDESVSGKPQIICLYLSDKARSRMSPPLILAEISGGAGCDSKKESWLLDLNGDKHLDLVTWTYSHCLSPGSEMAEHIDTLQVRIWSDTTFKEQLAADYETLKEKLLR